MKALVMDKAPAKITVHDDSKIVCDMDTLTIHNKPMDKTSKKNLTKESREKDF